MKRFQKRKWPGYFTAIAATISVFFLRYCLDDILEDKAVFLMFVIPVALAAWQGGLWPGLFSTALACVLGIIFFLIPHPPVGSVSLEQFIGLSFFIVIGVMISLLFNKVQIQMNLGRTEQLFRGLLESAPDAMVVVDSKGTIILVNSQAENMFGYNRDELLKQKIEMLVPKHVRNRHVKLRSEYIDNATVRPMGHGRELYGIRKDGSQFPVEISLSPLATEEGILVSSAIRDLTQRLLDEEERRKKDEFLAMLGHELRNPLAAIRNALHILHKTKGISTEKLNILRIMMEKQVGNLSRMVDDLLDISRITRGKIQLHKEVVEISQIISNAIESTSPFIAAHKHKLTLLVPKTKIHVDADPTRLEQVLVNILSNAVKYTKDGGHITVLAATENDHVSLRVKDTGIGINKDLLPKVFDLFIQGQQSLDRAQGGLGIGLTLVRKIVELHGGTVEAFSEGENKGSEFVVKLPIQPNGSQKLPDQDSPNKGSCRVLVVEDVPDVAETMKMLLDFWGHDVQVVHDGPTALVAYQTFRPDVILLDIGLPGMNGYEVAAQVRKDKSRKPFLMAVTGYGQEEDKLRAKEVGFDYHMTKPVDPEILQRVIATRDKV